MTKYEDIFDIAADNHGLITSAQAREAGITNNELVQYAKRGRVAKVGHGLYQLTQWVPDQNDAYAWAVMSVGPSAVLYGESVIAMLGLAPANPTRTFVATPRRTRRKLLDNIKVEWVKGIRSTAIYNGIPCQSAHNAILACKDKMLPDRLETAAQAAQEQGLISKQQYHALKRELRSVNTHQKANLPKESRYHNLDECFFWSRSIEPPYSHARAQATTTRRTSEFRGSSRKDPGF